MIIYADDDVVVFECEHCGAVERVTKALRKRSFQVKLNKFYRTHDWQCEARIKRETQIKSAVSAADEIIKRFSAPCL